MNYRKIGGLHWLTLGRLRVCWCWKRPKPKVPDVRTWDWIDNPKPHSSFVVPL